MHVIVDLQLTMSFCVQQQYLNTVFGTYHILKHCWTILMFVEIYTVICIFCMMVSLGLVTL